MSRSEPDVSHNLDVFPYPFENDRFEEIEASHVLEHLNHPFETMAELHRISSPGATIHLYVPHFSRGFTHADHKRGFDVTFPYYFNPTFRGGYQGTPLRLDRLRLHWFAQPYLKRTLLPASTYYLARTLGIVIDFFANLIALVVFTLVVLLGRGL